MPAKKAKKEKVSPPKSLHAPEEMRQWCALLTQELITWPQVSIKKMFGMVSFYRLDLIFAAVPGKKAYFSPYSIIFKLQQPSVAQQKRLDADPRINLRFGIGQKWLGFELASAQDIRGALVWLDEAYRAAKTTKRRSV